MKTFRTFILIVCLLSQANVLFARGLNVRSYQTLFDTSDLVVIATPIETGDTDQPSSLPGYPSLPVVGVITKFHLSAVLKGDKSIKEVVVHHYREKREKDPDPRSLPRMNEASLVAFSPKHGSFLLFLVREEDGRYAPFDQTDPALQSIQKLTDELGL